MKTCLALLLSFASASLISGAANLPAKVAQPKGKVPVYDRAEFVIRPENPIEGNPFVDASVQAEFSAPGGQVTRVEGFCDSADGTVFRVRFMPSTPGTYNYTIVLKNGTSEFKQTGSLTASASKLNGPVRVDAEHPFHFVRDGDGKHWFWNSTTTYQLLGWDDETIRQSVDRLGKLGINRIRVALSGRTKDGTRWNEPLVLRTEKFQFKMEPWVAERPDNLQDPGYDVSRFNLEFFRKAERLLEWCREREIVVSVIFYVDGADKGVDPFGKGRMGGPEEQRYYRYVIARLAAFPNVMWDITNEYQLFRDEAWANKMGALVKEHDPYKHIASIHGHPKFPFRTEQWADFAMFQSWDEHGGYEFMLKNRREQAATGRPIPQINEEYGYEDHYPYPWGQARLWPSRTADTRRRLAWEISMAGCYQTTGERANDGTGAGLDTGGGWVNGRGNDHMTMLAGYKHMKAFFEQIEWWKLNPAPQAVVTSSDPPQPKKDAKQGAAPPLPVLHSQPMCLAESGRCYVTYLPRGGAVTLELAAGDYKGRWFNPRSGEFVAGSFKVKGGRWVSTAAPDANDWVILLKADLEI